MNTCGICYARFDVTGAHPMLYKRAHQLQPRQIKDCVSPNKYPEEHEYNDPPYEPGWKVGHSD